MADIPAPELPERTLALVPERVARGDGDEAGAWPTTALEGRIRLGGPVSTLVSAAYAETDPALKAFVEQEARKFSYYVVLLTITVVSEPKQPRLEQLALRLDLGAAPSTGSAAEAATVAAPGLICWSMAPLLVTDPTELTTSWQLSPSVKLLNAQVSLGSLSSGTARQRAEVYLEGLNELRNDPCWVLRRTRGMDIRGNHRLMLVVRVPKHTIAYVDGTVRATVAYGSRPWHERVELPGLLSLSARL